MTTPVQFDIRRTLVEDCDAFFKQHRDTVFEVELMSLGSGMIRDTMLIEGRWLAFNQYFWRPLLKRNMPIRRDRHVLYDEDLTRASIGRINTNILWDLITSRDAADVQLAKDELLRTPEHIYNYIITYTNEHLYTADLISIAQTLTTPEAEAVRRIEVPKEAYGSIKGIEDCYKAGYGRINAFFGDPNTKPNAFYAALRLGILNTTQFPQLVGGVGPRTDTDDSMILLPIANSFMEGLEDIRAYAIESLAAKKSVHYNAEEMPLTQYTNRKQQLNSSAISRIYPGDCGTDVTTKFRLHKNFASKVYGKYIKHDGKVVALTADNAHLFWDKEIDMFTIMACRYTDGFCHKCGGMLAQYFLAPTVIPGIISGSEVMAPLAQQVLSNKHMATTFATIYRIPDELSQWMINANNDIYFRPDFDFKELMIGVPYDCVKLLADLKNVSGRISGDEYFSSLTQMYIANSETGEVFSEAIPLVDQYQSVPYLASDFLEVLRKHPEDVTSSPDGKTVWIKLRHADPKKPFLKAVVFNYSTKIFVAKIQHIFNSQITEFTSIQQYLETITNAIWTRIHPNILHLEVMGKASMITSATNYEVPRVTDPEAVMYGRLDQLIPRRSIGTQFAFEQIPMYLANPATYLLPKKEGPFDRFLGYVDGPEHAIGQ